MKLQPFSHTPGVRLLIPAAAVLLQAFPTLLCFEGKELPLIAKGPLQNFTVMQDLERHCVTIFSEQYSVHLLANLTLQEQRPPQILSQEIIDFGMHKKQLWEQIRTRLDFRELFPLWFRLGSILKLPEEKVDGKGPFALLEEIKGLAPEKIIPAFKKLFCSGFSDFFVPEAKDRFYQGIIEGESRSNPLYLLTLGAKLIRSYFLQEQQEGLQLLPTLPPELFAGAITNFTTSFGKISFAWSKKELRVAQFSSHVHKTLAFSFPSQMKHCRLRESKKGPSTKHRCGDSIDVKENTIYYFDRFEK